jgi:signal peptidase II
VEYDRRQWLVPLLIACIVLFADQASKLWVVAALGPEPYLYTIPLLGDWFRIIYAHNTGIAFSLFQGMSRLLIFTSLFICVGILYVYWTRLPRHVPLIQLGIGLIVAGALGNVIDRIRLGYVIDFIQIGWWPVFNLADSAICVGAVLLAIFTTRNEMPRPSREMVA